jgi:hypothetical protein
LRRGVVFTSGIFRSLSPLTDSYLAFSFSNNQDRYLPGIWAPAKQPVPI